MRRSLRQGVKTYIDVAIEAYKLAKEFNPKKMPELKLPTPSFSDLIRRREAVHVSAAEEVGHRSASGRECRADDKFGAVSPMPLTTERLLKEKPPELDTSLKLDRPAAMVTHIEFAKIDRCHAALDRLRHRRCHGKLKPHKEKDDDDG